MNGAGPEPGARGEHGLDERPGRGPLGVATFTIEGRAAPGLFVVGWLAAIMGAAIAFVGFLAGVGGARPFLLLGGLGLLGVGLLAGAGAQAIERRARGVGGYAGPSPFLVGAALVPVTVVAISLAGLPLVATGIVRRGPSASFFAELVTALVPIALLRLLVVGQGALRWAEMGVRRPDARTPAELAWGAALALPLVMVAGLLALALQGVLPTPAPPLPPATDATGRTLNFVAAAAIAPAWEELFYRGFALTAWSRSIGVGGAIVRSALFFALVHVLSVGAASFGEGLGQALFAFVVRLPVAFALAWVFARSGSLFAAIGLHAAYNGLPLLLSYVVPESAGT